MDIKYPDPKNAEGGPLSNKSHDDLKKLRDELRAMGLAELQEKEAKAEEQKKALSEKYGNI